MPDPKKFIAKAKQFNMVEKSQEDTSEFLELTLPSKGLPYKDKDGNVPTTKIRPMRVKDEKLIAEMTGINFESRFLQLLRNTVRGIDAKEMTIGDRLYCILWLRINSYSSKYLIEFNCLSCNKKIMNEFNLAKLTILELADDYHEPMTATLEDIGDTVQLRLLRVKDEMEIAQKMASGADDEWLLRYAYSMVGAMTVPEKLKYLNNLTSKDFSIIRGYQEIFNHGVDFKQTYTCPECEATEVLDIPFRPGLLVPEGSVIASRNTYK